MGVAYEKRAATQDMPQVQKSILGDTQRTKKREAKEMKAAIRSRK